MEENGINRAATPIPPSKFSFKVPLPSSDTVQAHTIGSAPSPSNPLPAFASNVAGALHWHEFGFHSIPTVPTAKRTAVHWDEWLNDLSEKKISKHWIQNPDHEVGFIVGDEFIVFDADSAESIAALVTLEKAHNVIPNMISKTTKGEHHFFKRAQGTFAKSDSVLLLPLLLISLALAEHYSCAWLNLANIHCRVAAHPR